MGIALPGDVLEKFVNRVLPLQHGVVVFFGADEVGQGKLLGGQEELERMAEGHFVRIVFAPGSALKKVFPVIADDQQLWGFAGAAGIFDDGFQHADVEM